MSPSLSPDKLSLLRPRRGQSEQNLTKVSGQLPGQSRDDNTQPSVGGRSQVIDNNGPLPYVFRNPNSTDLRLLDPPRNEGWFLKDQTPRSQRNLLPVSARPSARPLSPFGDSSRGGEMTLEQQAAAVAARLAGRGRDPAADPRAPPARRGKPCPRDARSRRTRLRRDFRPAAR